MISPASALLASLALLLGALLLLQTPPGASAAASWSGAAGARNLAPGHYEFAVAPQMDPPVVRKPPYVQSAQACPGSDPFASFSPRDTLCGDLNQGRVPLNPLGQFPGDQAYPFELIKNKTLQFLARALPVLKLEYETIPKVARYLPPAQHLLNPTHASSSLSSEHMELLNAQLAGSGLNQRPLPVSPHHQHQQRRRRRRRRRSLPEPSSTPAASVAHVAVSSPAVFLTVADLAPNASLLVSSAHSPAGRSLQARSGELVLHTKEGLRPIPNAAFTSATTSATAMGRQQQHHQQQQPEVAAHGLVAAETSRSDNEARALHAPASAADQPRQPGQLGSDGSPAKPDGHQSALQAQAQSREQREQQHSPRPQGKQHTQQQQQPPAQPRLACAESTNGIAATVCQAAAALIEGGRTPAWLQLVKTLGNAYSGAAEGVAWAGSPIWTALGLAEGASSSRASPPSSSSSTKSNLMGILGPVTSLLSAGSAGSSKDAAVVSDSLGAMAASNKQEVASAPSKRHGSTNSNSKLQAEPSLGAMLASSTMARLAMAGWASNALAGVLEYFSPGILSSASRSFARRKKPYDPQETFVDTPASLAATAAAAASKPAPGEAHQATRQPPTPCPSVEEYISPTFARNYQGAWKYVVQIPHEGYFTQTIQRTSCVRQKCEFTEGVCHESPRWVSLLVAEIYYPNAVFSHSPTGPTGVAASGPIVLANGETLDGQPFQHLPASATAQTATHSGPAASFAAVGKPPGTAPGQDPLQMTDSLAQAYNLNQLQALGALGASASDLSAWVSGAATPDSSNPLLLGNNLNYQLLQRQGLAAEARSSPVGAGQPVATKGNLVQAPASSLSPINNYDHIISLASDMLKQNPHMSINELLASLHLPPLQQQRKKRDIQKQPYFQSTQTPIYRQQHQQQQQQHHQQSLKRIASTVPAGVREPTLAARPLPAQPRSGSAPTPSTADQSAALNEIAGSAQTTLTAPGPQMQRVKPSGLTQQASPDSVPTAGAPPTANQSTECDGHDKVGCYVVRVYYDWFLVDGSCKCWKTPNSSSSSALSGSSGGIIRRIFTG